MVKKRSSNTPPGEASHDSTAATRIKRLTPRQFWTRLEHLVVMHQNPRAYLSGKQQSIQPEHLLALVRPLLVENQLEDGKVRLAAREERSQNSGPLGKTMSFYRDLGRDEQPRGMRDQTARQLVWRLVGFLPEAKRGTPSAHDPRLWTWPLVSLTTNDSSAQEFRKALLAIHAAEVLSRLEWAYQTNPHCLWIHADRCKSYLLGYIDELHDPLQVEPIERSSPARRIAYYGNSHDCISNVLSAVALARSDVTFVGAAFSISAKHGEEKFLTALACGVRLRFVVFDFMGASRGSAAAVANGMGLLFDSMVERFVSTIDALLELQSKARANGWLTLELRLLNRDPGMRRYIIDECDTRTGQVFFVPRVRGSLKVPAFVATNDLGEVVEPIIKGVRELWDAAKPISDDWIVEFRRWAALVDRPDDLEGRDSGEHYEEATHG